MLQYRKATKWTPNAFSNLILFKPILGFLRAWLMIFKHLGLQWLQLGIWYPLILFTKLLYNNCSPFHMSDPWLLVFTKAVPKPVPAGRLWHSLQSDSLPVLFRSGRGALTISRLHKAELKTTVRHVWPGDAKEADTVKEMPSSEEKSHLWSQGGWSTLEEAKVAFDLLFFSDMPVSPERWNSNITSVYYPGMHLICSP